MLAQLAAQLPHNWFAQLRTTSHNPRTTVARTTVYTTYIAGGPLGAATRFKEYGLGGGVQ